MADECQRLALKYFSYLTKSLAKQPKSFAHLDGQVKEAIAQKVA